MFSVLQNLTQQPQMPHNWHLICHKASKISRTMEPKSCKIGPFLMQIFKVNFLKKESSRIFFLSFLETPDGVVSWDICRFLGTFFCIPTGRPIHCVISYRFRTEIFEPLSVSYLDSKSFKFGGVSKFIV